MTTAVAPRPAPTLAPGRPRLIGDPPATTLHEHLHRHGPMRIVHGRSFIEEVEASGLRGRGGAGFPTGTKLRAVARAAVRPRAGRPVVVANGTEGEPGSAKDRTLLCYLPHLVLDGMVAASTLLGAERAILCIDRVHDEPIAAVRRALAERAGQDPVKLELALTPSRYTTGEETALVSWLDGGAAKPTFKERRPFERGVGGAPTLVDNVETLAQLALIARYGKAAFRSVGEADEPGTTLITVRGTSRPGVFEIPMGSRLVDVLGRDAFERSRGVLVGGYFGTWIPSAVAMQVSFSRSGLAPHGASPGCGLVAVLPEDHCPLQEVDAVLSWLAASSAGQCGACVNGLPALAAAFGQVVDGRHAEQASARLDRWTPMVSGRGACRMPDGAVKFLDSARRLFADHAELHARRGPCPPNQRAVLPTPTIGGFR